MSILFISKKVRGFRLYIDNKNLNIFTIKSYYLLSLINKILDYLYGSKVFIKLDIKNIYYRFRLR